MLLDCATWPRIRRAQGVIAFADGRSESVLESLSRIMNRDEGLPVAEPQADIADGAGFIARVDFLWREQRTVGEADGRGKYDGRESLWAEKRREDRLRELGFEVVRWGWEDLADPAATAERIRNAFARAARIPRVHPDHVPAAAVRDQGDNRAELPQEPDREWRGKVTSGSPRP